MAGKERRTYLVTVASVPLTGGVMILILRGTKCVKSYRSFVSLRSQCPQHDNTGVHSPANIPESAPRTCCL